MGIRICYLFIIFVNECLTMELPWHKAENDCIHLTALSKKQNLSNKYPYTDGKDECWRIKPLEPSAEIYIHIVDSYIALNDQYSRCVEFIAVYTSSKTIGDTLLKKWCGDKRNFTLTAYNEADILLYGGFSRHYKRKLLLTYYQDNRYDKPIVKRNSTADSNFSQIREISIVAGASVGVALLLFTLLIIYFSIKKGFCCCQQKEHNPKKGKRYLSSDK